MSDERLPVCWDTVVEWFLKMGVEVIEVTVDPKDWVATHYAIVIKEAE